MSQDLESHAAHGAPRQPTGRVREICRTFAIAGECLAVEPFERGHIHDTFLSTWNVGGHRTRYLHQRMNHHVFRDIPRLMHNIERVTGHLQIKLGASGGDFHTLTLVPTRAGAAWHTASDGDHWRTYHFIENTISHDVCRSPEQAWAAAHVFGDFQRLLMDIEVSELEETIPHFFSSPYRYAQLEAARRDGDPARREAARAEIDFAVARRDMVGHIDALMAAGAFPRRVVHGDTKLNNVLFSAETGKPVCVVDLDTCMPAYSLYDFGDLVRFTAARSKEDETDLDKIGTDLELYRALVSGYLESASAFLTPTERSLLPFAARLVTLTIGLRFLADYLLGDRYFKTQREHHNLDRCRVQFGMVAEMERLAPEMMRCTPDHGSRSRHRHRPPD